MSNKVPLAQATKESRKLKSVAKPKDMILDPMGQWKHPGENTRIPSNNITMQGVPYPVLAKPNVGQPVMMQPGAHYTFPGADYVDEFPKFAGGGMVEATVDENGEPKCPDGYDYNSATGYCEKKSSKCPDGYKSDGKGGCIEDRCQPGYEKDASGNCVPDTSGATYVEDENDPRYQDYLIRRKLNHISNIENPEIRRDAYNDLKKGYTSYDQFYDPEKGYTFDNIKTEAGATFIYGKDNYPFLRIDNIDPNKGDYDSKREIYKGLTIDQARDLEAYARSKGFDMGDQFDPYDDSNYEPDQFTEKYKPSRFDANVYYINSTTPNFSFNRSTGKYLQPDTAIVEDKINRERVKKYYPNITDEDINDDYATHYNSYISNIKDDYNSLWPQYSADPEIAKQTDVLAADDGSDITMDEHKKNIQDSAKAPNVINAPLNVKYDDENNPIIKGRRTSYKPDLIQDWINSTGRVVPYYDAPTDNYKFVTQPKSAELIQETQRAVPKFDDPELNLKKDNLPKLTQFGPLKDRKHIRYNNPFIVGTSNRPLNWAPYSAALRAFTGYKKGDEQKLHDEIKAANAEGRPVNLKGIPLMGKTDLKHRRLYKKALKDYEKNLPAIELENERRRQLHEEQLIKLNLQRQAEEDKRNATGLDPNALVEWKKGGGLKSKKYSKSLEATNRLFREHSFFEKPKKLSKKRIYDPSAYYFQDGGLTQYEPGGASADPPDWLTKKGANVYFNPAYQNNFTGSVNTNQSYFNNLPVFKQDPAAVFGIEGSLSKNRNAKKEAGRGWLYNAYVGMPYSQVIGDNAQYKPSAGIKFDYENAPQDKKFRPHIEAALDYNMHTGPLASFSGGARYPITPWGNKLVKPGYGVGHVDLYGGFSGGAGAEGAGAGLNYGARIQGKYQPRWLDRLSRGSYLYGEAGIQFDPVKGKIVQKATDQAWTGGQDQGSGEFQQMVTQERDPGTKWGSTVYANVGIKKDLDDIKFKNNDRSKRIRDIEEKEKQVEHENYKQEEPEEEPKKEKSKKECPEGERRSCENCSCEPIEKHKHPRWLQDGGEQDGMNGMMKARLAYANEFGNPAAQRMINLPDNPYEFENGDTGTHYMASMDNYAVPQIQDENGQLMLGDYGPDSREAMRFDSDEDADYFAEHYKDVSPGFIEAELSDDEIQEYAKGGYIVEDISVPELSGYAEGGEKCPDGYTYNSETGYCEKAGDKCPPGYEKDPDTGRCRVMLKACSSSKSTDKKYKYTDCLPERAIPKFDDLELELEKPGLEDYDFPKGEYYPDKKKYLDWRLHQRYNKTSPVKVREKNIIRKENPLLRFVTGYDRAKKNSRLYKEHREWDDKFKKELGKINSNPEDVKFPSFRGIPVASWEDLRNRRQYKKDYKDYVKNELPLLIERNKQAEADYDQELQELNLQRQAEEAKRNAVNADPNTIIKWKYGGTPDYQLGDEIDEATMKRLKKLGYTFEKI